MPTPQFPSWQRANRVANGTFAIEHRRVGGPRAPDLTGRGRASRRLFRRPSVSGFDGMPGGYVVRVTDVDHDGLGRNETTLERTDRNLVELLQEVRVVQTGVQVLFGFLLMAPLTARFRALSSALQMEYFATLLLAAAGAILLIAPTAYHRALFRRGDKEYLICVANRLTIAGLSAVGLAMVGSIVFVAGILFGGLAVIIVALVAGLMCVVLWAVLPLRRRRRIGDVADPGCWPKAEATAPARRAGRSRAGQRPNRGMQGASQGHA